MRVEGRGKGKEGGEGGTLVFIDLGNDLCVRTLHSVQVIPCESAVGDEGITDVYESVVFNAVVSEVEGGEGRVGLE